MSGEQEVQFFQEASPQHLLHICSQVTQYFSVQRGYSASKCLTENEGSKNLLVHREVLVFRLEYSRAGNRSHKSKGSFLWCCEGSSHGCRDLSTGCMALEFPKGQSLKLQSHLQPIVSKPKNICCAQVVVGGMGQQHKLCFLAWCPAPHSSNLP